MSNESNTPGSNAPGNMEAIPYPLDRSKLFPHLVAMVRHQATTQPDAVAYTFLEDGEREGARWSFAQFDERARAIAVYLLKQGQPGDRVMLLYPQGLEFMAAFFGCLYAGMYAVPAYPPEKNNKNLPRIKAILDDCCAPIALTVSSIEPGLRKHLDNNPSWPKLEVFSTDGVDISLAEEWQHPDITGDTIAFLQYTSGSTGNPKGVMVTHHNLVINLESMHSAFGHDQNSVMVSWIPLFHDMGMIYGALQPLYNGFHCVLMSPAAFVQRPLRWLQAITRYRGTHNASPNFAFELCIRKTTPEERATLDLSSWKVAMNAAEPIRPETQERFLETFAPYGFGDTTFCPAYGMAECTLLITANPPERPPIDLKVSAARLEENKVVDAEEDEQYVSLAGCGLKLLDFDVVVVDVENKRPCDDREIGHVWLGGDTITGGYWNRAEVTRETFHNYLADGRGPFLSTGDLGFTEAGEFFFTGRAKDLIIIRGMNYYPQDIEYTIWDSHESMRAGCGAAFSVPVNGEEGLCIVQEVIRKHQEDLDTDYVFSQIRRAVSENHGLPVYGILLIKGPVPKTSSGKIQRRACRQGFLDDSLPSVVRWEHTALSGKVATEEVLPSVALTQEQLVPWLKQNLANKTGLAMHQIDSHESFRVYGLGSVHTVEISAELESLLGRKLPATILYNYPSIQSLAAYLCGETQPVAQDYGLEVQFLSPNEPVAVVGLGCRFPGAPDPDAFWHMLTTGHCGIVDAPSRFRSQTQGLGAGEHASLSSELPLWDQGGFLPEIADFDAAFFGIPPLEVENMDPQQRLALEVAWETLEHADISAATLEGSATGVFMGVGSIDNATRLMGMSENINTWFATGNAASIVANRISYQFDLRGPSIALDTACSSSLVAVHQACSALRSGDCDLALSGGVNILLNPVSTHLFHRNGMLAPDGRCKTFDTRADGYVRGEGCGMVALKRLSDAQMAGNRVLALIRGSAVNQDGRTNGLTAPNGLAQEAVLRKALGKAGVHPAHVGYVEAHGSGTRLGDPIEMNALAEVLAEVPQPIPVGAVKTNIGHLEIAAGIAGLIKTVLCMQHQTLVPNLGFSELNPMIAAGRTLYVPHQVQSWTEQPWPRIAGVSSFGFGGTNAHVILEEAPRDEAKPVQTHTHQEHLFMLSARSPAALRQMAADYAHYLKTHPQTDLQDLCYTLQLGRVHHPHRLVLTCNDVSALTESLNAWHGGDDLAISSGHCSLEQKPKVAFLFTGQGAQYVGMGKRLYESEPTFRQVLNRCAQAMEPLLPGLLLEVMHETDESNRLNETGFTQPALYALQVALGELWLSWGVVPQALLGHSIGEFAAAALAGVFSVEDGLKLVLERARLMQALPREGSMTAVFAKAEEVEALVAPHQTDVSVAAYNGAHVVLSGRTSVLESIGDQCATKKWKTRSIPVSHAFHSPLMTGMVDDFRKVAEGIRYGQPRWPIVSTLTGKAVDNIDADYWCQHITAPVRFEQALTVLNEEPLDSILEVGPKPTLLALASRILGDEGPRMLPSLRPNTNDVAVMHKALGQLYLSGSPINFSALHQGHYPRSLPLPTYPWQRQRFWNETPQYTQAPAVSKQAEAPAPTPTTSESTEGRKRNLPFGMIFFSGSEDLPENDKYGLLMDCAMYGDQHGYSSIWVPERHFSELGGLYPNPSVVASAIAMRTQHMRVHAGSVVLPLHNPIRVAEEWAVVDNLSGGRVGVSFAPGWNPVDFSLSPQNYNTRHNYMYDGIETIRALWRGDALSVTTGAGETQAVTMHPQPLQHRLPIWITAAGNPKSFAKAGSMGTNLLTHMLDSDIDLLREKIAAYREARAQNGYDPNAGTVTVMLHTFVGDNLARVRELGRLPFRAYLKSNLGAFKALAYSRGVDTDFSKLPADQLDDFLDFLYERFAESRGLIGTPDSCMPLLEGLIDAGVDEIVCLLEWGAPRDVIMAHLPHLTQLMQRFNDASVARTPSPTLPYQQRETVTPKATSLVRAEKDPDGLMYRISWEEAWLEEQRPENHQTWVILTDEGGLGHRIAQALQAWGDTCLLVRPEGRTLEPGDTTLPLDASAVQIQSMLERVASPERVNNLIYLWGLDTETTLDPLQKRQLSGHTAIATVQAISHMTNARLFMVTRGARRVEEQADVSPWQAPLWGLGATVAQEHGEIWGGLLDLDPNDDPAQDGAHLLAMLAAKGDEDRVAVRKGRMLGPRLRRHTPEMEGNSLKLHGKTYLVTGAFGGLGPVLARWLAEQDLGQLALVDLHRPTLYTQTLIDELQELGCKVRYFQADVTQREEMVAVIDTLKSDTMPLKGVLHMACALEDGLLMNAERDAYSRSSAPPILGAYTLSDLTVDLDLDHFVLFSSIAANTPFHGQAGNAMATAFLDALAHRRRAQGLAASSINLGTWLVDTPTQRYDSMVARERLTNDGILQLNNDRALAALRQILCAGDSEIAVFDADWAVVAKFPMAQAHGNLVAHLTQNLPEEDAAHTEAFLKLVATEEAERPAVLKQFLMANLSRVLGRNPEELAPEKSLNHQGFDSLMAVELRNRIKVDLGLDVSMVSLLENVSIKGLTTALLKQVAEKQDQTQHEPATEAAINVRHHKGPAPLSFPQTRLWFLQQLDGAGSMYNTPVGFHLHGHMASQWMELTLQHIIWRHDALRSRFYADPNNQPLQEATQPKPVVLPMIDLSGLSEERVEATALALASKVAKTIVALDQPPLLRGHLLRLGHNQHQLLLSTHHMVFDGWSASRLFEEINQFYAARCEDRPAQLPDLPLQYADYAIWQREHMAGEALGLRLDWWRTHLQGLPQLITLPTDRPRPPVQTFEGDVIRFHIDAALDTAATEMASQVGATRFMVLLATWGALLSRYSDQTRVAIGTPIANRGRHEVEHLIGYFANTLVMAVDMEDQPTGETLLERVRTFALGAYDNQDLPFEKLVDELKPTRDLSYTPLFQVAFSLLDQLGDNLELPGLETTLLPLPEVARFDIELRLSHTANGLAGRLVFNADLFDRTTAEAMAHHYQILLKAVTEQPTVPVHLLPLTTAEERAHLLQLGAGAQAETDPHTNLYTLLTSYGRQVPHELAVMEVDGQGHVTHRWDHITLHRQARSLATQLRASGVGPEVPVCLVCPPDGSAMVALMAIYAADGIYVPIDANYPAERCRTIVESLDCPILLSHAPQSWCPEGVTQLILGELIEQERPPIEPTSPLPYATAYLIFTSGSTGKPKGVAVSHGAICNRMVWAQETYPFTEEDRFLALASPGFDISLWERTATLLTPATLVLPPANAYSDADMLFDILAGSQITAVHFVPSLLKVLLADYRFASLEHVRLIFCGGEAVSPEIRAAFRDSECALHLFYGPTEAAINISALAHDDPAPTDGHPLGQAIRGTNLYVLDANLQPQPQGMKGQIYIAGLSLARGYLNDPAQTAQNFIPHPFASEPGSRLYATGDKAHFNSNGQLLFGSRMDHQIKLHGHRIEPDEIAAVLCTQVEVAHALVQVVEPASGQAHLVAFVECSPQTSADHLRSLVEERLPSYMVPKVFVTLETWPLLPNGKLNYRELHQLATEMEAPDHTLPTLPTNATEQTLHKIWCQLLNRKAIDIDANFFTLGGDSIIAIQVVAAARESGLVFRVRDLFQHQSIAALARHVRQKEQLEQVTQNEPFSLARLSESALAAILKDHPHMVDLYPLAPLQAGMLFHALFDTHAHMYANQAILHLQGTVAPPLLKQAMEVVINRHDALCAMPLPDTDPLLQGVFDQITLPFTTFDLHTHAQPNEEADRVLREDLERGMALNAPPLLRVLLIQTAPQQWRLGIVHHHMILDGWSLALVMHEVFQTYAALSTGQRPEFNIVRPYRDFIAHIESRDSEKINRYWQHYLAGFKEPTPLPAASGTSTNKTAQIRQLIPEAETTVLKEFARTHGVTLNALVQTAWGLLLSHYGDVHDVVFGTTVSGRPAELEGVQQMVGLMINTLPLRMNLGVSANVVSFLQALVLDQGEREDHGAAALHQIQANCDLAPNSSLFDTLLVFENYPEVGETIESLPFEVVDRQMLESLSFGFALTVHPHSQLSLRADYDAGCYKPGMVTRILSRLTRMLHTLAANPNDSICNLPFLDTEERQDVLLRFNRTAEEVGAQQYLPLRVFRQAERTPDAIAVASDDAQLTYATLVHRAKQLAANLQTRGVGADVTVGVAYKRTPDMVVAMLGVLCSGGAYVPLDPTYPLPRLQHMLEDSSTQLLLLDAETATELDDLPQTQLIFDRLDSNNLYLQPIWDPNQLAYIIYTSGSTGLPKGVQQNHEALANFLHAMCKRPGISPSDKLLAVTTVCFDISILELFAPLCVGAQVVLANEDVVMDGTRLAELLEGERITLMQATPITWKILLASGWLGKHDLTVLCGGEALPADLAQRLQKNCAALWNMYGPTETAVWSAVTRMSHADSFQGAAPLGEPISNTTLHVLDRHMEPVPIGVVGQLYIGGRGLSRGYRNQPARTATSFVVDPFAEIEALTDDVPGDGRLYATGDLVRRNEDGTLDYLGRRDQQLKLRGFRIEPGEIEATLREHVDVKEAVVLTRRDTSGQDQLVGWIVPRKANHAPAEEVLAGIREQLPAHMVPVWLAWRDAMPKTLNQKVDRKALALEPPPRSLKKETDHWSNTQTHLIALWEEVLGVTGVSLTDNFFALGGHSLLAIRLLNRVEQVFGVKFDLLQLFNNPTVEAFATEVEKGAKNVAPKAAVLLRSGEGTPLFCICGLFLYRDLALRLQNIPTYAIFIQSEVDAIQHEGEQPTRWLTLAEMAQPYVEEILRVQPKGPYRLAGISFGGLLSYEIAKQLREMGHTISFLGLLDTFLPGAMRVNRLSWIGHQTRRVMQKGPRFAMHKLTRMLKGIRPSQEERRANVSTKAVDQLGVMAQFRGEIYHHASHGYVPEPTEDKMYLFRATDLDLPHYVDVDSRRGWAHLAQGGLEVHDIGGDHLSMLHAPHVDKLSKILTRLLENTETGN